jgi:hypothetical protein
MAVIGGLPLFQKTELPLYIARKGKRRMGSVISFSLHYKVSVMNLPYVYQKTIYVACMGCGMRLEYRESYFVLFYHT